MTNRDARKQGPWGRDWVSRLEAGLELWKTWLGGEYEGRLCYVNVLGSFVADGEDGESRAWFPIYCLERGHTYAPADEVTIFDDQPTPPPGQ